MKINDLAVRWVWGVGIVLVPATAEAADPWFVLLCVLCAIGIILALAWIAKGLRQ